MKNVLVATLAVLLTGFGMISLVIHEAHAQSLAITVQSGTALATTVTGCPTQSTATPGFTICMVVPTSGTPFLAAAVSNYNSGAPFSLAAAASGVSSFNGRTGNVMLTKGDVTGTGIAATSTTTASTTASTTTTLQ